MPAQEILTIEPAEPTTAARKTRLKAVSKWALLWSVLAIGYWLTMLIATHIPTPEMVIGGAMEFDKLLHAGAYFVLATVLFITARRLGSSNRLRTGLLIVFGVITYGAIDELTQPYFNRSCDLSDWIADSIGVLIAFAIDRLRPHKKLHIQESISNDTGISHQ